MISLVLHCNTVAGSGHMNSDKPTVKDSGVRESFDTGSVRDSRAGKGRYDLLPTRAIRRVARHFEAGAAKYGDRNWEKGQPISRYLDSALRHTFNHLEGQRDEDHLAAAAWNILAAIETEVRIADGSLPFSLDDLPDNDDFVPAPGSIVERLMSRTPEHGAD